MKKTFFGFWVDRFVVPLTVAVFAYNIGKSDVLSWLDVLFLFIAVTGLWLSAYLDRVEETNENA